MAKNKILIIENKMSISVTDLVNKLAELNYIIEYACCGQEGIIKSDKFNPDLILLDPELPDINSFEMCRYIKNKLKKPIIILSPSSNSITSELNDRCFNINRILKKVNNFFKVTPILEETPVLQRNINNINIGELSHELRTPLTVIAGFVQLLKSDNDSSIELYKIAIENIERESNTLLEATETFLTNATKSSLC